MVGISWQWVEPVAEVLNKLGCDHVWVVHGHDGLDELTTTARTEVAEAKDGKISVFEITPQDAGLPPAKLSDLKGGNPAFNAAAIRDLLDGKAGPFRDIVLLNAAAALIVGGKAPTCPPASNWPRGRSIAAPPRRPWRGCLGDQSRQLKRSALYG